MLKGFFHTPCFCRRLQAIEKERSPQVLAIQHSDEEDQREGQSEDEEFASVGTNITDGEEEKHEDTVDTSSPDSSPGEFTLQTHFCTFQ